VRHAAALNDPKAREDGYRERLASARTGSSSKRTVRILRRRAAGPAFPPDQRHGATAQVMAEITRKNSLNPPRRDRTYPRVVK
jgi:hypothetical protein